MEESRVDLSWKGNTDLHHWSEFLIFRVPSKHFSWTSHWSKISRLLIPRDVQWKSLLRVSRFCSTQKEGRYNLPHWDVAVVAHRLVASFLTILFHSFILLTLWSSYQNFSERKVLNSSRSWDNSPLHHVRYQKKWSDPPLFGKRQVSWLWGRSSLFGVTVTSSL